MKLHTGIAISGASLLVALACSGTLQNNTGSLKTGQNTIPLADTQLAKLCNAAIAQTYKKVTYDGSYFRIPYPGGDIPDSLGVCTDVIIRAYRKTGYDLQKLVHEDMNRSFAAYEKRRKNGRIDPNIDHRRCPNLETFFSRHGEKLTVSPNPADYKAGDIVFWDVAAGHVGLVVNISSESNSNQLLVVHNIGSGPQLENYLFKSRITGHYRYHPWKQRSR